MSTVPQGGPPPELAGSLYYLLKHAQMRLADLTGPALAPLRINGRETAVLIAIDGQALPSQHDIAQRMGVDRTTMVGLVDELVEIGRAAQTGEGGIARGIKAFL